MDSLNVIFMHGVVHPTERAVTAAARRLRAAQDPNKDRERILHGRIGARSKGWTPEKVLIKYLVSDFFLLRFPANVESKYTVIATRNFWS